VKVIKCYLRGINLIASEMDGMVYYYIHNEHGDVAQIRGENGTCKASYEYDAFGIEKNPNKDDQNPFRYCGEYYDLSSGTYYLRNRYYNPVTGRFTQEDPIRNGLNYYTYARNNPLMYFDPMGLAETFVQLRKWFDEKLAYCQSIYDDVHGVLDWIGDTHTASMLLMAGGYGGYGEFKEGVDGAYIKDGRMYVKEQLLWQAFGKAIDPPIVVNTTRDTVVLASAIVLAVKGPAIVKGVEKAISYVAPIIAGAGAKAYDTLQQGINFTNTTLQRMQDPNRFVPVHTLMDAIRYGTANPDPQGSQAIMYTIEMFKNGKAYQLEVLYDKASNTIFHFLYK